MASISSPRSKTGRTAREIVQSDSDSGDDEFDGFSSGSDIDIGSDLSDLDTSGTESDGDVDDEWTPRFSGIRMNDFTGQYGPIMPDDFDVHTSTPLDYFWLLFGPEMFIEMTRHTNNYARWKMDQDVEDNRWVETTPSEIRAFVGMNIYMGINSLPSTDMYWSTDCYIGNTGISGVMSSNRYQKLNQYFHVSDRATEPRRGHLDYDRLYKVRPVIDHVTETFLLRYVLGRELCVDEAMIRYTGRLSFRQYMPAKPVKRGIKIWMACDSNSAFLSRFSVYLGRTGNQTEHGLGYNVVTGLTDNLHGSHRRVYFDNYFTSIPLMQDLFTSGLYACGTVRVNRKGFPVELKKPRDIKDRGQYRVLQKGRTNLTASVWKDKRLVHHLSTLSDPSDIRNATRRVGPVQVQLRQPSSVCTYNQFMGGVDQHDQLRMKYELGRNSKKWWRYLFWFLLNCAIVNAFIIYKHVSRRTMKKKRYTHLDFRMEMARDLIAGFSSRKRKASEVDHVGLVEAENVGGHIHGRLAGPKGRCRFHLKHLNMRRETVFGCTSCRVHLCKDGCHGRFHNL